jgi:hypothetical protein
MMSVAGSSMRIRAPLSVCRSQPCTPSRLALALTERRLPTGSARAGMDASINAGNGPASAASDERSFPRGLPTRSPGVSKADWADSGAAIRRCQQIERKKEDIFH